MNNHRLLARVLAATLLSGAVCAAYGQSGKTISLEEIFELSESRSAQLRPSFSAEDEAIREIAVARSGRLPDISTSLSFSYIGDGFTTERNFSEYQKASIPHLGNALDINVTQPIYAGGAISNAIKLAEHKSTAARYSTELNRNNIRFQLTGFYLDIYKYHNLRQVVSKNILQANKVLDNMKSRYEQGVVLSNDITRYELLLANLSLKSVNIDNTLAILNRNLVTIAGMPESTVIIPDSAILTRSLPTRNAEQWEQEARSYSPTLKLAQSELDISRTSEAIIKSERLPKIGLNAGWSINGPILVEVPPIDRNLSYWHIGLGISYNLSSLYKSNKTAARSRAAVQLASDKLNAATENVELQIKSDYIRYLEAYEALNTRQKGVELARRNYNIIATRYSAGMALVTDILDAANAKLDAEQQLVNARINIIYYYYKLLFTSGKI